MSRLTVADFGIEKSDLKHLQQQAVCTVTGSDYKYVYIIPSNKFHDSGYKKIAVIGEKFNKTREIASFSDDITWKSLDGAEIRMEMDRRNVIRLWGNDTVFRVPNDASSITITAISQNHN